MGRGASHIALEVGLATSPNYVLIGEQIASEKKTLAQIVGDLADVVAKRSAAGKDFGVVLVPEGLLTYIPEMKGLIQELNAHWSPNVTESQIVDVLTPWSR